MPHASYDSYTARLNHSGAFSNFERAQHDAQGLWSEFVYCVAGDMERQAWDYATAISWTDDKVVDDIDAAYEWICEDAQYAFDNSILWEPTHFKFGECNFTARHANAIFSTPDFWRALAIIDDAHGNSEDTLNAVTIWREGWSIDRIFYMLWSEACEYICCVYDPETYQGGIVDCIASVWESQADKALATA